MERLPVDEVLPELVQALRTGSSAVLVAPPGAGKTTRVPQALVDTLGVDGQVIVLEPRRLAARLAAERIAKERGQALGGEVGYQVRFEDRTGDKTKIAFLTEGILTRRLQDDPFLEGVGAVVLDEFHERSVHADLAIAFLHEVQASVRPELKLVVMSATLDAQPVSAFLGGCPIIESEGRSFPVERRWLERADERRVVDKLVSVTRRALSEQAEGDLLAFLPGAPEIRMAQDKLTDVLAGKVDICPLYGELEAKAQDRAVRPGPRRRLILATNIAESSLTIPGVRVVVDGGEQKRMSHDPSLGMDRLERVRISRRSVEQRAGRAGRLGPGVAYRCWTEKEEQSFSLEDPPELLRVDLSAVLLQVLSWAPQDPLQFGWFVAPRPAAVARGLELLRRLGALGEGFQLSERGKRLSKLPLHPRLGVLLLEAASKGILRDGARIAAIASERDILPPRERQRLEGVDGRSDLLFRLDLLKEWEARGPSSAAQLGLDRGAAQTALKVARRLEAQGRALSKRGRPPKDEEAALLRLILAAYPDRVARKTSQDGLRILGGGRASLPKDSVVKSAEFMVAVRVEAGQRGRGGAWLRLASEIDPAWLKTSTEEVARFNAERLAVETVRQTRYGDFVLDERPRSGGDRKRVSEALEAAARADLDRALPLTDALMDFFYRLRFLREAAPDLDLPEIGPQDRLRLLPQLCAGKRSFAQLQKVDLPAIFQAELGALGRTLAKEAPRALTVPSGSARKLRYAPEGPPLLSVRLQEVFGMYDTPRIARGRVPVKMELLAPNQRPVQLTQDLRSFWENTYAEVRKELRRRYPKHQWPEDPKDGIASARVLRKKKR